MLAHDKKYPDVYRKASRYVKGKYYPNHFVYVFCDSEGEEIEGTRIERIGGIKKLSATMEKVLKEQGRGIPKSKYIECKSSFELAEALFKVENYGASFKLFEKVTKKKVKFSFIDKAKEKRDEIDKMGKQMLEQAQKAIENKDYERGLQALFDITVSFNRLPVKKDAQTEIKKLKDINEANSTYKKLSKISRAKKIYINAETYLIEGNKKKAVMSYKKLVRGYKKTEYAEKAKERLAELGELKAK